MTAGLLLSTSGCSLFVMAGKAMFGDPKVQSPLRAATGIELAKSEDSVLIICSASHRILSHFPSLQIDLVDRIGRDLEIHNIHVVPSGDVAAWFDDHGEWGDYSELGEHFHARYIMHVDVLKFDYRVPESENLLQGQAEGNIRLHEISRSSDKSKPSRDFTPVRLVFDRNFAVMFPTSYPVPRESRSEDQFLQTFLDRTALHIGQHVYDYRSSESIH
ncbi:MAG: hypothetical protein KDA81_20535 [Planctomycetaceae bacterium]|nr:hypothetical protein [Planctomycetaceae bacterium]